MKIQNATSVDIDKIFELYKIATAFQKSKGEVHWPIFERTLVEEEIKESRQWKILIDNRIACVWATTNNDPQIWQEKNADPSIYIHRIATNPEFRGQNLVGTLVNWAKDFAKKNNKQYLRMDTVGENWGLINYYKKCGFEFLGLSTLTDTIGLPGHYQNATVSLFQLEI